MIHEMLPATNDRVTQNTSASVNEKIRSETLAKIDYYRVHKNEIDKRLEELEREWDTERFLEANASTLCVMGVALGFTTQTDLRRVRVCYSLEFIEESAQRNRQWLACKYYY
jgi:hypothetical protein